MIIPISYPVFNEAGIVKVAKETLDKSISSTFDGQIKPLVLLSRFFNGDNELQGVREAGALLRHLFYGFFIIDTSDTITKLIAESSCSFKVMDTIRVDMQVLLITGTMQQWCESLINCLSPSVSYEVRVVMNEIMNYFDSIGLQHIFAYYRRRKLTDTTYVLEDKR
jgi:hypothetical protein